MQIVIALVILAVVVSIVLAARRRPSTPARPASPLRRPAAAPGDPLPERFRAALAGRGLDAAKVGPFTRVEVAARPSTAIALADDALALDAARWVELHEALGDVYGEEPGHDEREAMRAWSLGEIAAWYEERAR